MTRWVAALVLGFAISGSQAPVARAAELIMFEAADCVWCQAWDREVGAIYAKTDEARIAPLRRVDIDAPRPQEFSGIRRVVYTPTFVLMENGREIGRITGYPGESNFWGLLGVELGKLGVPPQS